MTPQELALSCIKAINESYGSGISPKITLKLPESKKASHTRYPWGRKGPKGTAIAFGFDGFDVVVFDAVDLLAFLAANGVVTVSEATSEGRE